MPCHAAGSVGGFQRRFPVGGAANGIPRNATRSPSTTPCTCPDAVCATVKVVTFIVYCFAALVPFASVTVTVKFIEVYGRSGVPEITKLSAEVGSRLRPVGIVPATNDQVN